jgi:hypothetical protein
VASRYCSKAPLVSLWELSLRDTESCLFEISLSKGALFSFIERLLQPLPLSATQDTSTALCASKVDYEGFLLDSDLETLGSGSHLYTDLPREVFTDLPREVFSETRTAPVL